MKKCTKCLCILDYSNFRKDKTKKDWYYSSCSDCYRKKFWVRKRWTFESPVKIHWLTKTRFYKIFRWIIDRCLYESHCAYYNYGWRWIKNEWKNFEDFKNDMYESYLKHCEEFWEKQTTIDRIDVNWNYNKENCKWSTLNEQWNNKRNIKKYLYNWNYYTISDLSKISNLKCKTIYSRIVYYWYTVQEALYNKLHSGSWNHKEIDKIYVWEKRAELVRELNNIN